MSKRKNRVSLNKQVPSEETIKSVMELYAPNKIQKFFMRYFSPIMVTNKVRNWVIGVITALLSLGIFYNLLGVHQAAIVLAVTACVGAVPVIAGQLYNYFTDKKRVKQICDVLGFSEVEVLKLEEKYYLN